MIKRRRLSIRKERGFVSVEKATCFDLTAFYFFGAASSPLGITDEPSSLVTCDYFYNHLDLRIVMIYYNRKRVRSHR